jgi:hypothetical protein
MKVLKNTWLITDVFLNICQSILAATLSIVATSSKLFDLMLKFSITELQKDICHIDHEYVNSCPHWYAIQITVDIR